MYIEAVDLHTWICGDDDIVLYMFINRTIKLEKTKTGTPSRPSLPIASALSSHPMPGAHRPRPCTSGTASSATTSSTVVVSTSTKSASRQGRPSLKRFLPAPRAMPAQTARPGRRRSRESQTPCHRENALTSSFADWRRRCERKSKSYPKASHLRKSVRSFTVSRTLPQSPQRTPPRRRRCPAMVQAMGSTPSTTADGDVEEEVDVVEAEAEGTLARCAQPGAPNPPINQP